MNRNRSTIALAFLVSCTFLVPNLIFAADVTVNLNATYQTIDGFGGMQDRGWTGYNLLPADRNTLFGNGPNQLGFSILRIRINENQNSWSIDLPDAKDAASRGIKVFATAWSPPTSLRVASGSSYKVDPSKYQAYVDHLNGFAKYMKDNGVNLYALGFQNEPDWCGEWSCGSTTEMYNFAKNWGSRLRVNGNKVITAESFSFNKGYYDPILNDATTLANVDILGTHFYGTSKSSSDATFDYTLFKQKGGTKPFWMTEVYTADVNNQGSNKWPLCLDVAYEMHRALALSNMSAYVWWYLKRNYGPLYITANNTSAAASAGTISKVGALMGQYSKYVRPGAVRVDATRKVQTDVYTSAFMKADSVVLVVVNMASAAKTVSFSIPTMQSTTGQRITTSGTKSLVNDGSVAVSSGNFTAALDAQSTTTFVFSGNSTPLINRTPGSIMSARSDGIYRIFELSGKMIGKVCVTKESTVNAEVRKTFPNATGLYLAKSFDGSSCVNITIQP
jgi:glucuronoarabinoxylan endo-1,4-beta-xylanase